MVKKNKVKVRLLFLVTSLLVITLGGSLVFLWKESGNAGKKVVQKSASTATPTLTATTQIQPLFFDDFVNSHKGWSLTSVPGYTREIENGNLTLADEKHTILTESLPTSANFDDFTVTAILTLEQANPDDSVGLYMRGDSYLDHDYRFDIYGDNTYAISKEFLDQSRTPQDQFLIHPTATHALHPVGQQNIITVMMNGPQMVLLINGTNVNSVTDTDYTSGQIALFVQNSPMSSGVKASFSSVAIYSVPHQPPNH